VAEIVLAIAGGLVLLLREVDRIFERRARGSQRRRTRFDDVRRRDGGT